MDYPKKFDVCPICSSMNRVIEQEVKAELAKGNIRTAEKTGVITLQTTIFDPTAKGGLLTTREFPIIMSRFDICADCGTFYCVEVDKGIGKATPQIIKDDHKGHQSFMGAG